MTIGVETTLICYKKYVSECWRIVSSVHLCSFH